MDQGSPLPRTAFLLKLFKWFQWSCPLSGYAKKPNKQTKKKTNQLDTLHFPGTLHPETEKFQEAPATWMGGDTEKELWCSLSFSFLSVSPKIIIILEKDLLLSAFHSAI